MTTSRPTLHRQGRVRDRRGAAASAAPPRWRSRATAPPSSSPTSPTGQPADRPHDRGGRRPGARRARATSPRADDVAGRAGRDGRGVRPPGLRLQQRRRRAAAQPTADVTEEEWDRIIAINLRGVFLCMKYEIPLMLAATAAARSSTPPPAPGSKASDGGAAYAAAKHGVLGLTKDAALDYAPSDIRINAICPGIIDTPMMQRFTGGTPEGRDSGDRAGADRADGHTRRDRRSRPLAVLRRRSFVVGHAMVVDGGQTV